MSLDRNSIKARRGGKSRRDFLYLTAGTLAATGVLAATWPLIDSLNPSAEVEPSSRIYIDLPPVAPGERITAEWRGIPIFVSHRTPEEIAAARADDGQDLPDPDTDRRRVQREEWLVVVGLCTHLGCVLYGQTNPHTAEALRRWDGRWYDAGLNGQRGRWGGWFCPCCASHFDTAGRVRVGLAPRNLDIPPYRFLNDRTLVVG